MVIGDAGRIERDDAAAVQEQRVEFERRPVVDPGRDFERRGVALVQVELSAAAHRFVPGPCGRLSAVERKPGSGERSRRDDEEFAARQHARDPTAASGPESLQILLRLLESRIELRGAFDLRGRVGLLAASSRGMRSASDSPRSWHPAARPSRVERPPRELIQTRCRRPSGYRSRSATIGSMRVARRAGT